MNKVVLAHYPDFEFKEPSDLNAAEVKYRVEVTIDGILFLPDPRMYGWSRFSCMSKEEAGEIAQKTAAALNVTIQESTSDDVDPRECI